MDTSNKLSGDAKFPQEGNKLPQESNKSKKNKVELTNVSKEKILASPKVKMAKKTDGLYQKSKDHDVYTDAMAKNVDTVLQNPSIKSPTSDLTNEEKKEKVLNELSPTWKTQGAALESITDRMKDLAVPGARITVFDKKNLWSAGFGKLENSNSKIQSASISKTITGLTILSLIEEKIVIPKSQKPLTLDTDIKDILDEDLWKSISNGQKEPITIRQLMAHTAGLEGESYTGFRGYYRDKDSEISETNVQISHLKDELLKKGPNKNIEQQIINLELALKRAEERAEKQQHLPTVDEIIKGEGTNSPPAQNVREPGSGYAYAGGGAMILQKIIEIIMNRNDFGKIVDERVFSKLEMKQSTFSPEEYETIEGYRQTGDPLPGGWMQQPELAAAGLWSTPEDLAKVLIGIQGSLTEGSFISQSLAKEMITPYFENEINRLNAEFKNLRVDLDGERINEIQDQIKKLQENLDITGLGVFIEKSREATYFYHSGSNIGFRCLMIANDQDQGAVVMTNSETGIDLIPEVIRKIAEVYEWKGSESFSDHLFPRLHPEVVQANQTNEPIDLEKWKEHKGIYTIDDQKVEIKEENGKFVFKTPGPTFNVKPVTKNIGIFQEHDGRWFPLEFKNNILTVHGRTHTKLDEKTAKTSS